MKQANADGMLNWGMRRRLLSRISTFSGRSTNEHRGMMDGMRPTKGAYNGSLLVDKVHGGWSLEEVRRIDYTVHARKQ